MKAMCIDEKKDFVWQDIPDPACHGEFDVKLKVLPIAEATDAHAILERGESRGKVVLTV